LQKAARHEPGAGKNHERIDDRETGGRKEIWNGKEIKRVQEGLTYKSVSTAEIRTQKEGISGKQKGNLFWTKGEVGSSLQRSGLGKRGGHEI